MRQGQEGRVQMGKQTEGRNLVAVRMGRRGRAHSLSLVCNEQDSQHCAGQLPIWAPLCGLRSTSVSPRALTEIKFYLGESKRERKDGRKGKEEG